MHDTGSEAINRLGKRLSDAWHRATGGDRQSQAGWQAVDGGNWQGSPAGMQVRGTGPEWLALSWEGWDAAAARELGRFTVEVTVTGTADAAGISFGPYKDFLASVSQSTGPRHIQLEVDVDAACWALRHQRHTVLFAIVAAPVVIVAAERLRVRLVRARPELAPPRGPADRGGSAQEPRGGVRAR